MADGRTAVVLAGGKSERMGRDKARLSWGATTLLEHVCGLVRPLVDEVVIAVDAPGRFPELTEKVVADLVPGAHALGGLHTGLKSAEYEHAFVCGCDAPFLNPSVIELLFSEAGYCDLVVPSVNESLQPLHAVYAKSALRTIELQLRDRKLGLKALATKLKAKVVEADTIGALDPGLLSFVNINTPADYEAALSLSR